MSELRRVAETGQKVTKLLGTITATHKDALDWKWLLDDARFSRQFLSMNLDTEFLHASAIQGVLGGDPLQGFGNG